MEVKIVLSDDGPKQGIIHLKKFIDVAGIAEVESTEIERAPHRDGQMGMGMLLNSISTVMPAASSPLVELVKCMEKYTENYRTKITISTECGNIVLEHGRSVKPDQLKELVAAIQTKNC